MNCPTCNTQSKKFGKDRKGLQRFRCLSCKKTFLEPHKRPLGEMRLPLDKAVSVIQHLVEGCSVRSTERITGVEKRTILSLLALVGPRCEKLMEERIKGLKVKEVACDEIWGYVSMKAKTKNRKGISDKEKGDAWCFIGMERYNKLILAWHLGHRTADDTEVFTEKLAYATEGNSQINTLTNAFSKKWLNLKWAYALQFAYYNFCRPHMSLEKCTPAMAAKISTHVWTIKELIGVNTL